MIPQIEARHRMGIALEAAGVTRQEMADHLGLHLNTLSNWMTGRTHPRRSDFIAWAMRCGVPLEWLINGTDGGDDAVTRAVTDGYRAGHLALVRAA